MKKLNKAKFVLILIHHWGANRFLIDLTHYLPLYQASIYTILILKAILPLLNSYLQTLGEAILMATMIGARDVLMTCDGWLMVSQSNTTSCELRHSSKIRFTSS